MGEEEGSLFLGSLCLFTLLLVEQGASPSEGSQYTIISNFPSSTLLPTF